MIDRDERMYDPKEGVVYYEDLLTRGSVRELVADLQKVLQDDPDAEIENRGDYEGGYDLWVCWKCNEPLSPPPRFDPLAPFGNATHRSLLAHPVAKRPLVREGPAARLGLISLGSGEAASVCNAEFSGARQSCSHGARRCDRCEHFCLGGADAAILLDHGDQGSGR